MPLLNTNFKMKKLNGTHKVKLVGLSLAPYTISGRNTCSHASPACANSCLFWAGNGQYPNVQKSRIQKTKEFFANPQGFLANLAAEIKQNKKAANRKGWSLAVRLNVLSDLRWETIKLEGKTIFEHFPKVRFFDYTKNPTRYQKYLDGEMPANYHLTFSRSETNHDQALEFMKNPKATIAVVFDVRKGKALPQSWEGYPVFDGDISDMRWRDPKGHIIGLKAKGTLRTAKDTGFVIK